MTGFLARAAAGLTLGAAVIATLALIAGAAGGAIGQVIGAALTTLLRF